MHVKIYRLNKKKGILVMLSFNFLRRTKIRSKKRRIPIYLFDKNRTQIYMNKFDSDEL